MLKYLRFRRLSKAFERSEKLVRADIYKYINGQVRYIVKVASRRNRQMTDALERNDVKWFKFRGFEEIEAIPLSDSCYGDAAACRPAREAMAAALGRVLAWHRCAGRRVLWVCRDSRDLRQSGFARFGQVLRFDGDYGATARRLESERDYVLAATPAILAQLAYHVRARGLKAPRPRLVLAYNHDITNGAESLIKEVFGAPIARIITDSGHTSLIATCRYNYYHLVEPVACHEIVDRRGVPVTSGRGALVATPLHVDVPGYLRYNTGVEVVANKKSVCPCGLTYRALDDIAYTAQPALRGVGHQTLTPPLPQQLHPNIVGVRYEQSYDGEVVITLLEHIAGHLKPNDYKKWYSDFWNGEARVTLIIDNRHSFLGEEGLSNCPMPAETANQE